MMNDPMAGISAQPGMGGRNQPAGDSTPTTKEIFDPIAMAVNMQRIERIRSVMGITSGVAAGILGLTGLLGFGKCASTLENKDTRRRRPSNALGLTFAHSLFHHYARNSVPGNMGVEDEVQFGHAHETIMVCVLDGVIAVDDDVLHVVLDALLRARISLLVHTFEILSTDYLLGAPKASGMRSTV